MFSHELIVENENKDEEEENIEEEEEFDEEPIFGRGGGGLTREGRTMTRRNIDRNIKRLRDLSITC